MRGDPPRLQQVVWNLLQNAFKFTESGGRITLRTFNPSPGLVAVSVSDTGMGITAECLERIFQPFNQGSLEGRHRFGGLGLGLAICKAITDLHGGRLLAESAGPGQGATFTLELSTVSPPGAGGSPPQTAGAAPGPARPLRLLLVEDHETTLDTMAWLLRRDGHTVFTAQCAREALEMAHRETCDALISDIGLPDSSGLHLMREITRLHGWPGIALSGYGMPSDLEESKAAGFSIHLVKPVKIGRLRQALLGLGLNPPPQRDPGKPE